MADIVVVHGASGAGKSTHCRNLTQFSLGDKGIYHISAGDRLRAIRLGEFNSVFSAQVNAPDASDPLDHGLVNGIIFEYISGCPHNSIVLVDGYPRFRDAIPYFRKSIDEGRHSLLGCINFTTSRETAMARFSVRGARRGERIFGEGTNEWRFGDYLNITAEAIDAFREFTRVVDIDAEFDIESVWESYMKAFRELVRDEPLHL